MCAHIRKIRQCRKFTLGVALRDKSKENEKAEEKPEQSSTSSSSESDHTDRDSDSDEDDVSIEYCRGLPQVTVPLPSRKEKCVFTLRPVSNTVGDFLEMLKKEDKGIDRAVTLNMDGTRIASSNTIETLLEEDFKLIINDSTYNVKSPKIEKLTTEETKRLSDIRNLVNQLYITLNVGEHQIQKEKDIHTQLETLQQELQPLEQRKLEIELVAHRRSNWLAWAGLGLMSVQFGILARLTWWEYSWDIMEPVTYFVTYGTAMACYAYFVVTKEEYILPEVKDRQHLILMHKKAKKLGLDLNKYNHTKDQIRKLELDLRRLRDPLHMHLPPKKSAAALQEPSSWTDPIIKNISAVATTTVKNA